jgi:hypothetical protein
MQFPAHWLPASERAISLQRTKQASVREHLPTPS